MLDELAVTVPTYRLLHRAEEAEGEGSRIR